MMTPLNPPLDIVSTRAIPTQDLRGTAIGGAGRTLIAIGVFVFSVFNLIEFHVLNPKTTEAPFYPKRQQANGHGRYVGIS